MIRLTTRIALLVVLPFFATAVAAQKPDRGKQEVLEAGGEEDARGKGDGPDLSKMTPEERLEYGARRGGARGHVTFVAACRPDKLLPGETGTLLITAILQKSSVLRAPAQVSVIPVKSASAVEIGTLTARPPQVGRLAPAFIGRPVYENTAVFEAPITMGAGAPIGQTQTVAVDLKFDVYNGETGTAMLRTTERVTATVQVAPNPNPAVDRAGPPVEAPPSEVPQPVDDGAGDTPVPSEPERDVQPAVEPMHGTAGVVPQNAPQPEPEEPATSENGPPLPDSAPIDNSGGGLPIGLIAGGGALLVLIVLLLLRRK